MILIDYTNVHIPLAGVDSSRLSLLILLVAKYRKY